MADDQKAEIELLKETVARLAARLDAVGRGGEDGTDLDYLLGHLFWNSISEARYFKSLREWVGTSKAMAEISREGDEKRRVEKERRQVEKEKRRENWEAGESVLTSMEVAALLKLHPGTIQRFVREGRIQAHRFGREYRFSRDDIRDYVESQRVNVTPRVQKFLGARDALQVALDEMPDPDEESKPDGEDA